MVLAGKLIIETCRLAPARFARMEYRRWTSASISRRLTVGCSGYLSRLYFDTFNFQSLRSSWRRTVSTGSSSHVMT